MAEQTAERRTLYARLMEKRESFRELENNISGPFVAVAGKDYREPSNFPRLMFVGKATYKSYRPEPFTDPLTFDSQAAFGAQILNCGLDTAWWRNINRICSKVLPPPSDGTQNYGGRIVWNNLLKSGCTEGNPEGQYATMQRDIAREFVLQELEDFAPTHVIIPTSNFEVGLIESLFGICETCQQVSPSIPRRELSFKQFGNRVLIWCMHPERKSSCLLEQWQDAIVEKIRQTSRPASA